MSNENKGPSLVLICIAVPASTTKYDGFSAESVLQDAENQLRGFEKHFVKLGNYVVLADQDECFPAIINLVDYCNQRLLSVIVAELSEGSAILSPEHRDAIKFLKEKGRRVRLAKSEKL
jgi:hypothetical protein